MALTLRWPRSSRLLKLLLFQSGLFLSIALYLSCTSTMGEPFPEIKSTHSLVAKYVTKPLWDKLSSVKTKTSGFTLAKVCNVKLKERWLLPYDKILHRLLLAQCNLTTSIVESTLEIGTATRTLLKSSTHLFRWSLWFNSVLVS